jgi:c-di-GMP-binding flagellar brake protein YcgR
MKILNQERTGNFHPIATENDRRKHRRILIDLPFEYRQINNSKSHFGCARDISEGGLLLYLPEEVQVGHRLNLFIFSGELKCIEAIVEVVWKEGRSRKNKDYPVGVKFVNISWDSVDKIKKILGYK